MVPAAFLHDKGVYIRAPHSALCVGAKHTFIHANRLQRLFCQQTIPSDLLKILILEIGERFDGDILIAHFV